MDARRGGFWYARANVLTFFYVLVVQQIAQGLYSLFDGFRWLQWVRQRLARHPGLFSPRVAVICPCKGAEPGLAENLTALTQFDYTDYELFFTLARESDSAHALIKRLAAVSKRRVHIVIAGPPSDTSDKVNNLRAAVEKIGEDFGVLVFVDSDGRPGRGWLARLVAPLADPQVGAATTFRWYLPAARGFWSALASAWNAPIVTMLGGHDRNFCWGGGTAVRRETFWQAKVLEFWRGASSDDYSLTRALRQQGLRIEFVPGCLVPTWQATDFSKLMEFTNRQILITRVYEPKLWRLATLTHLSYCVTVVFGLWVAASSSSGSLALAPLLLTLLVPLLAAGRGVLRLLAAADLLPGWKDQLMAGAWVWTLLAPLVPFLYLVNSLAAIGSRRITWRGIRYELVSPNQTRILSR